MTRKTFSLVFLTGLIVGAVAAIMFSGDYATPRALAQVQPQTPHAGSQRYQISAWAYPPDPHGTAASHGAYVLDSRSGEVFLIDGSRAPKSIGRVPTDGRDEPIHISDPLRTPQTPPRDLRR